MTFTNFPAKTPTNVLTGCRLPFKVLQKSPRSRPSHLSSGCECKKDIKILHQSQLARVSDAIERASCATRTQASTHVGHLHKNFIVVAFFLRLRYDEEVFEQCECVRFCDD